MVIIDDGRVQVLSDHQMQLHNVVLHYTEQQANQSVFNTFCNVYFSILLWQTSISTINSNKIQQHTYIHVSVFDYDYKR